MNLDFLKSLPDDFENGFCIGYVSPEEIAINNIERDAIEKIELSSREAINELLEKHARLVQVNTLVELLRGRTIENGNHLLDDIENIFPEIAKEVEDAYNT